MHNAGQSMMNSDEHVLEIWHCPKNKALTVTDSGALQGTPSDLFLPELLWP